MVDLTAMIVSLFSVLVPLKGWYAPHQPIEVMIQHDSPVVLVMTGFDGTRLETETPTKIEPGQTVDLRKLYPSLRVGTYLAFAVPEGRTTREYLGTPLVVQLRGDARPGAPAGTVVVRVEPLVKAIFETDAGEMVAGFYYDEAPNTAGSFIRLAREGFYDGLTFHRIIPGFVLQGGDPLGTGTGGPGYEIDAEFNARAHTRGVLSMAREGDPLEPQLPPRSEYANSAGSQFFICLDYARTRHLDRKYTAFGMIVEGDAAIDAIAQTPIKDANAGTPVNPPVIKRVRIEPVTAAADPYPKMLQRLIEPTTQPSLVEP
jgi:peptidyl-prolyl cis-trans isomerase B (cyclophilin B)